MSELGKRLYDETKEAGGVRGREKGKPDGRSYKGIRLKKKVKTIAD